VRLFEITSQFKALAALEDSDELPPEVIADTLEGLEGDFEAKTIAVAKFILSLEANAAAIEKAADAMALSAPSRFATTFYYKCKSLTGIARLRPTTSSSRAATIQSRCRSRMSARYRRPTGVSRLRRPRSWIKN